MSEMTTVLIGSINVACRDDSKVYIACGIPLSNSDGKDWLELSPDDRWALCVEHLCKQVPEFQQWFDENDLQDAEGDSAEYILFSNGEAMCLVDAVQDDSAAKVLKLASVQTRKQMDMAVASIQEQGDELWEVLFEYETDADNDTA